MATSTSGQPVAAVPLVRRHLIALPRGRPTPSVTHRHLIAIPRGRPVQHRGPAVPEPGVAVPPTPPDVGSGRRSTVPIVVGERPRRGSHSVFAVVSSVTALVLLCCGAAVMLVQLMGVGGRR
ncbi:hypothetical protein [Actinoplanes sp. NPDC020271]|uniref:hypothetical protein n=1 Tax=Actinoplanes sp. NPDC020271 TaxID=3363896 RepID=UPI0037927BD6